MKYPNVYWFLIRLDLGGNYWGFRGLCKDYHLHRKTPSFRAGRMSIDQEFPNALHHTLIGYGVV